MPRVPTSSEATDPERLARRRALVQALDPVRLPRDELVHQSDMEWWYFVAHVQSVETEAPLSLMVSVIRRSFLTDLTLCVVKATPHATGPWKPQECGQIFRTGYSDTTNPVAFEMSFRASVGNAFLCQDGAWAIRGAPGEYRVVAQAAAPNGAPDFDLQFHGTHPAVPLRKNGIMDYGLGHELAYYVRPKITVQGSARFGERVEAVKGVGWYERQWGPWPKYRFGWKYLNINLSDGEQWLLFRSTLGTEQRWYAARFPKAGGIEEFDLQPEQFSDVILADRPSGTDIHIPTSDGLLDIQVRPLFPAEGDIRSPYPMMPDFWEGVSKATGQRGAEHVEGFAMTEMHSYV